MESNSAFYNLKQCKTMANLNVLLLDVLQQLVAAICGVYFNENEKKIFVVRPWTGDSEIGLFNTLFFNEGSAQLRVVVEEFSSENFIKSGGNNLISYNTLVNRLQPLDLESNKGDLDGFSKSLNAAKKLWGFREYQEILKNFLQEERFDFSTYEKEEDFFLAYFPNTIMAFGWDDEERIYRLVLNPIRVSNMVVNTPGQEEEMKAMISRFLRILLQPASDDEETVE